MADVLHGVGIKHKEVKMRKIQIIIVVIAGLLFSLTASAQDKQAPRVMNKIEPLPRDLEIQLALSALPPHLRDNATVYILNPAKGFEVAHKGTNGFHAFVARTGDDAFRGSWPLTEYRGDILYPISFDKAGSKAQMRVYLTQQRCKPRGLLPANSRKSCKTITKQDSIKRRNEPASHTCCLQC
jgi:hypothetical protein